MGGFSAAYSDYQSINFNNPASYSRLNLVTYDIGLTIDSRTLKSKTPVDKYQSVNFTPSYVMLGVPLSNPKQRKSGNTVGLVLGLRPVSTVRYSVEESRKLPTLDSIIYLYEGNGGLNEAFIGVGKRWGKFSVGINAGYRFGRKETNTRTFVQDTSFVPTYRSNSSTVTSFGSGFINAGIQYEADISKKSTLKLGATGNAKQTLSAQQDIVRETFYYDGGGGALSLDSIYIVQDQGGKIKMPASLSFGASINTFVVDKIGGRVDRSMVGVEYHMTNWNDYRFYEQKDNVANSWQVKIGGMLTPDPLSTTSYWNRVSYRAGFNYGRDHVVVGNQQYNTISVTAGLGFPIRKWRSYDNQYTNINTSFEFGRRGGSSNNITESFFRFSVGLNLSDIWFIKRRYD